MIDYYHGYRIPVQHIDTQKKSHVNYWNQMDNHNRQSYWPLSLITCMEPLFMAIIYEPLLFIGWQLFMNHYWQ